MSNAVAVVGMSGRFPGAPGVDAFWKNICQGIESIGRFSDDELAADGISASIRNHPRFVNAGGALEGIELFDARLFGYSPREAEIIDPQQRIFLECAWESLEHASYNPFGYNGLIGVYAGTGPGTYQERLKADPELAALLGQFQLSTGNEKDHLTTRVAYKLDLHGPAVTIQTTCSSSLVAVVLAYQGLLTRQCDVALAGGVCIVVPQRTGYLYTEGGILSPDGHCRAFDVQAQGAVGGNGCGVVVLRRLDDALADGAHVHAIITGAAINNDGSRKVGYTAPSVDGQAEVIIRAQAMADVSLDQIGYVEAHGTGTPLGDPIEVAALTEAFRRATDKRGYCALGSVKTNVGHLDAAAGITGLIKAVLAVEHGQIPPTLHFREANPALNLATSPFFVNRELRTWPGARRAGVSSFGIGGTNAHVVVEEKPPLAPADPGREHKLIGTLRADTRHARGSDRQPGPLPGCPSRARFGRRCAHAPVRARGITASADAGRNGSRGGCRGSKRTSAHRARGRIVATGCVPVSWSGRPAFAHGSQRVRRGAHFPGGAGPGGRSAASLARCRFSADHLPF